MDPIFFNYQFRYIIIGNSNVGKTKLLLRYTKNEYINTPKATIGIDYGSKTEMINDDIYSVLIYDTAGTEIFHSLTKKFYSNATCVLIVYDITNRDSLEKCKNWMNDVWFLCQENVVVALVGNKNDMNTERVVSYEEGKKLADENNILFFEASAKTGKGVNKIFEETIIKIKKNIDSNMYDDLERNGIKNGFSKTYSINLDNTESFYKNDSEGCCQRRIKRNSIYRSNTSK